MLSYNEAISLLRNAGCSYNVINHCKLVSEKSVQLARKLIKKGVKVDLELCQIGGLLHDIGRSKVHTVFHGVKGGKLLRKYPRLARIAERHVGGGINKNEASIIGLPEFDYLPETIEEKIVCYADKFVQGEKIMPDISEELKKLEKKFGKNHISIIRLRGIRDEIKELTQ